MDPATLSLAISLARFVPKLLRWMGGDGAAEVAEQVVGIAENLTGQKRAEAVAAIERDPQLALQFQQLVVSRELEFERMALRRDELEIEDKKSARAAHAGNQGVFRLGIAMLVVFAAVVAASLYGAYQMLVGGVRVDASMFAAVSGFVGTLIGYVSAKADQVISYFFGSSIGSKQKTDAMAQVVAALPRK